MVISSEKNGKQKEEEEPLSPELKSPAYRAMQNLLGARVVGTLSDGRQVEGQLICLDRRRNLILADCTETRTIVSSDYVTDDTVTEKMVQRRLQQAMIPGEHLTKLEIDRTTYQEKVAPIILPVEDTS